VRYFLFLCFAFLCVCFVSSFIFLVDLGSELSLVFVCNVFWYIGCRRVWFCGQPRRRLIFCRCLCWFVHSVLWLVCRGLWCL